MSEFSNPEIIDEAIEMCEVQSKLKVRNQITTDNEDEQAEKKQTRKRKASYYGSTSSEATSRRRAKGISQAKFENLKARVKALEDKIESMETKIRIIEDAVEKLAPGSIESVIQ